MKQDAPTDWSCTLTTKIECPNLASQTLRCVMAPAPPDCPWSGATWSYSSEPNVDAWTLVLWRDGERAPNGSVEPDDDVAMPSPSFFLCDLDGDDRITAIEIIDVTGFLAPRCCTTRLVGVCAGEDDAHARGPWVYGLTYDASDDALAIHFVPEAQRPSTPHAVEDVIISIECEEDLGNPKCVRTRTLKLWRRADRLVERIVFCDALQASVARP